MNFHLDKIDILILNQNLSLKGIILKMLILKMLILKTLKKVFWCMNDIDFEIIFIKR